MYKYIQKTNHGKAIHTYLSTYFLLSFIIEFFFWYASMKVFENDFGQLEYDEFAKKCCKSFELDYKTLSFILYKDFRPKGLL